MSEDRSDDIEKIKSAINDIKRQIDMLEKKIGRTDDNLWEELVKRVQDKFLDKYADLWVNGNSRKGDKKEEAKSVEASSEEAGKSNKCVDSLSPDLVCNQNGCINNSCLCKQELKDAQDKINSLKEELERLKSDLDWKKYQLKYDSINKRTEAEKSKNKWTRICTAAVICALIICTCIFSCSINNRGDGVEKSIMQTTYRSLSDKDEAYSNYWFFLKKHG